MAAVATLAAVAVQVSLALENISAQYAGFEGRSEMQGKVQMSLSNGQLTCHNLGDKRSEKRMNRVCQPKNTQQWLVGQHSFYVYISRVYMYVYIIYII